MDLISPCHSDNSGSPSTGGIRSVGGGTVRVVRGTVGPCGDATYFQFNKLYRRFSADSQQSSESGSTASRHNNPLGSRSSIDDPTSVAMAMLDYKTDSVAKFQAYLRTRGLRLDLSSVLSSDV